MSWVRRNVALAGSLSINLLLIGVITGAWVAGPRPDRSGPGRDGAVAILRALEPEDRRALLRDVSPHGERGRRRVDRGAAVAAIEADPFDRAAFERLLTDQVRGRRRSAERGVEALGALIEGMSADDRAALAARLARR